jgi:PadR family transcriptional regulator, regulatory protein PadR
MATDRLRGHLRTLVLAMIAAREPIHGYGLIAELQAVSDGHLALNEGAVYPTLHQLEAARLITSAQDESSGRKRRCYSLTNAGRVELADEARDWAEFRDAVDATLKEIAWLAN